MSTQLPPEAFAATLAGLPMMTPRRLTWLLRRLGAEGAWAAVAAPGGHPAVRKLLGRHYDKLGERWAREARRVPPERTWARCEAAGVGVLLLGDERYPMVLAADVAPPPVLFSRGDLGALAHRRVTIVGTRNATALGRDFAANLGEQLAAAGVAVVSGLARGIDGAAHRGALRAAGGGPPVGVVACGLDAPYPREHRDLWAAVADAGVLLAEVPPGTAPEPHRFPARNRILAALAEVVVVVESRAAGGSLLTAEEGSRRGVLVMAVPGSPMNASAAGTNTLIRDGCPPVLAPEDVLTALGLAARPECAPPAPAARRLDPDGAALLELFAEQALDVEGVAARTGRSLLEVAVALGRLEEAGWLVRTAGWFERASLRGVP